MSTLFALGLTSGGRKGRGKGVKSAAAVSSDEASDGEGLTDHEPKEPPQPRPRRSGRSAAVKALEQGTGDDTDQTVDEGDKEDIEPTTPTFQSRLKPSSKEKSSTPSVNEHESPTKSPARSTIGEALTANGAETPIPSRKRTRPDEDEGMQSGVDEGEVNAIQKSSDLQTAEPSEGDIQIRRKRVRH